MKQNRLKLALGGLVWVVLTELHHKLVHAAFPQRLHLFLGSNSQKESLYTYASLAGNFTLPSEQVLGLVVITHHGFGDEAVRVLFPPVLCKNSNKLLLPFSLEGVFL